MELMDTVFYQQKMIYKFGEGGEADEKSPEKCANYCKQILETCTHSVHHVCLRIEALLRSINLPESKKFCAE